MPFRKEGDPSIMDHPWINDLAKKYNKTNPQIVLRALIQKQIVVIPKSILGNFFDLKMYFNFAPFWDDTFLDGILFFMAF